MIPSDVSSDQPLESQPSWLLRKFAFWQWDAERRGAWRRSLLTSATAISDQVVVSGLGFATSIIIGRQSKEMLGIYFLAFSIVLFVRGIQESLIAAPFKVFCHRFSEQDQASYAGSTVVQYSVLTAAVCCVLLLVAVSPMAAWLPSGLGPVISILVVVIPLLLLRELFRQLSFARLRFQRALILDSVVALVQLAGLLWLAHRHELTVGRAFSVMAVACGGATIGWLLTSPQPLKLCSHALARDWKANWEFGRWAVAAQVVGALAPYIVPWILSVLKDSQATGMFAACMTMVGASRVITDAVFNLLTPKSAHAFHHGGRSALVRMLVNWGTLFAVFMGIFTVAVFLIGEWGLVFVYGDQYAGTTWPLTILAAALWIHTIGFTCGDGLFVLERTRDNFWADVVSTGLTVIVSVPLVSQLGVTGAALATLVALASGAVARFLILRRCLRILDRQQETPV